MKPSSPRKIPKEERKFLDTYDVTQFERPSVTVDVVILTLREGRLEVLLVKRAEYPFRGFWSLPGGFVGMRESLDAAAARVLCEKGGLEGVYLEQLYTFGAPERDPRTRVLSVAYYALVEASKIGKLAQDSVFFEVGKVPQLAFDHAEILEMALSRIRGKLEYVPIGFELLPERFTLRGLQEVHEAILGRRLNKDSFRRKMLVSGMLRPTGELETGTDFRPAELYVFKR
ncbi:NUDIX hydrolase [Meiothermus granaticius]|uniref:GDP-mannose mannosyl hydrolase n=1 Tax=Meiothermus granaticius NBRC 107808 TaxID=1227551 RepID=A0A399F7F5_9DEIN|nr:NUDIX domain-containing protein [Meiothermus granaticius]RIH92023.1 GDP-mannose mannosyl hydrolase [Meiothermus granaticius NBRC 107808]GEM86885.1 NUDIX hydrolase [Meiothermus granaticius NBRC 107808]